MPALHLVRHAEPAITGVLLGHTDPPLSEAGRQQCPLILLNADVLYTSPLLRTRETAELIAHGREIVILSDLAEMSLGEWDGKSWPEIERDYPDLAAAKLAGWTTITPPGGEPWEDFSARVDRALSRIRSGVLPAAVIGHLAVNAAIACRLNATDPLTFTQQYAEIRSYEI